MNDFALLTSNAMVNLRLPALAFAALLLGACSHLDGKDSDTGAGGSSASRPGAAKPVSPEREEQYIWFSELA